MKPPLKIGGVPEHFNLPWQLALEKNRFSQQHIDLEWTFYAGGTGAMTKALSRNDLDLAILLTEGFFSAACNGLQAKIVKQYTSSPLVWGIYTGANSGLHGLDDNTPKRYAISRFGSGSHLMAGIHANQRGVQKEFVNYIELNSLHAAIDALQKNEVHYFYWEKFMTAPFVKQQLVNLIGEFSAPWPGMVVVANDNAIAERSTEIHTVLEIIEHECESFRNNANSVSQLSQRFPLSTEEAKLWLRNTEWKKGFDFPEEIFSSVKGALSSIMDTHSLGQLENYCAAWIQTKHT